MEAVEFCKLKYGNCVCEKTGEVHCLKVLREVQDPAEIEAAERKRRSKYIEDEPAPMRYGGMLAYQELIREAMAMRSEMIIPSREDLFRGMYEPMTVEKRVLSREEFTRNPIYEELGPYPTAAERRLGSSEKDYVKFHQDPVKRRPS